jgi:hypothetical protein
MDGAARSMEMSAIDTPTGRIPRYVDLKAFAETIKKSTRKRIM